MTDNIQKLYEIAGVDKQPQGYCDFQYGASCPYDNQNCDTTCPYWVDEEPTYPPFTAEKQLELIKWITKVNEDSYLEIGKNTYDYYSFYFGYLRWTDTFEQGLCGLILRLWEEDKLTDDQKQEIKEILE